MDGVDSKELADAAQLSSLADETPEGRSVVVLAKEQFGIRGRSLQDKGMQFIPFTAVTRMSGVDFDGNEIRKGAADAMQAYVTPCRRYVFCRSATMWSSLLLPTGRHALWW